jgi:hypothetical protein
MRSGINPAARPFILYTFIFYTLMQAINMIDPEFKKIRFYNIP